MIYVIIPWSLIFFSSEITKQIISFLNNLWKHNSYNSSEYVFDVLVSYLICYKIKPQKLLRLLQDFTLDMYFRQFWKDPRLSFEKRLGLEKLVVGAEYIKLIWVPDTFFVNEKTAYFHDATTDNQFLRILHTGEILRSIRWVHENRIDGKWQPRSECSNYIGYIDVDFNYFSGGNKITNSLHKIFFC